MDLRARGFTLIELMIVIAVVAILLALAVPTYSNYATRAKIAEGLSVAMGAKTAVSATCQEDPTLSDLDNATAGFTSDPTINSAYVETIGIDGPCSAPIVYIQTKNTGTSGFEPLIVLTGGFGIGLGRVTWTCHSDNTPHHLLPDTCRS